MLAPNAADRQHIVPGPCAQDVDDRACAGHASQTETSPRKRAHRLALARLLARVFLLDVAALTDPASIRNYLEGVGLPARAPPVAPARPHPQHELEFAA